MNFSAFDAYVDSHADEALQNLIELSAIPSVETNEQALNEAVTKIVQFATQAGIQSEVVTLRSDSPPIVTGEAGTGEPLLMVYNHYDVQPADPLDEWICPPFQPTLRDGHLYARGVADNKVNLVARLFGAQVWRAVYGDLPVHLRFVWEGEEESGGEQLALFTKTYADWISAADGCLWESGYRDDDGSPVLTLGLKGLACLELRVKTGALDAHSGQGGLVPNAVWRLVEALSTLRAPDGTVLIDGFNELIVPPTPADLALLRDLPWNAAEYRARYGVPNLVGERDGVDALQALFFGTTCTINGISGGYEGVGSKTVIPCEARAKLDLRLVPNLDPGTVVALLRAHLARRGFSDVEVFEFEGNTMPARTSPDTAIARASIEALRDSSGHAPIVYPISPGSGPMYELCHAHGVPAANFGCGWSGSHVHAPNENIRVADFIEGIKTFGRLMEAFPRYCAEKVTG